MSPQAISRSSMMGGAARPALAALVLLAGLAGAFEARADSCSASASAIVSRSTGGTCDTAMALDEELTLTYRMRNASVVDSGPNDGTQVESTIFAGAVLDATLAQEDTGDGSPQLPGVLTFVPVCPADSVGGLLNPGDECDPSMSECGSAECGCAIALPGVSCEEGIDANHLRLNLDEDVVFAGGEQKSIATVRVRVTGLVGPPAVCGLFFTRIASQGDVLATTDDLCDSELTAGAQADADLHTAFCDCDDDVECTVDACNQEGTACENIPDDSLCDNDTFCDGEETCDVESGCQAGTPPDCDDDVDCTNDVCDSQTDACASTPDDSNCDNDMFCDGDEVCDEVEDCQPGTPPDCDDGIECTGDSCNETTDVCDHAPNNGLCANGEFCDGTEICNASTGCVAGIPVPCGDAFVCSADSCNEGTDSCDHDFSPCVCGDSEITGDEVCDPPLTAGTFEDCHNGVDDDGDGDIDCRDKDCKKNAREPVCDEDCELDETCEQFIRDPARITFNRKGGPDEFYVHGRIPLRGSFERVGRGVSFDVSNEFGAIYRAALGPGDLKAGAGGRYFLYRDRNAELLGESSERAGLSSVRFRVRRFAGVEHLVFRIRAYADLSAANHFNMTTTLSAGPEVGYLTAEWTATARGWVLYQKDFDGSLF